MRIVLIGAPGSGKEELAQDIRQHFMEKGRTFVGPMGDADDQIATLGKAYAVGEISDYRTEITLAADRTFDMLALKDIDTIFTGSIFDSIAHTLVYVAAGTNAGAFSYGEELRWEWTTQLIYAMMLDSFEAEHVFYLRGGEPIDLAEFYPELLDQIQVDYVELEGDRSAYLETVLQKLEADEPRPDNGDTEPKDA